MKSTGIIRKVDELGRIVLPIELRRTLDIAERDELEIFMENDRIVLQKFEPACLFCGSSRSLVTYRRKNVCQEGRRTSWLSFPGITIAKSTRSLLFFLT